jgi:hypothetical protein
MAARLLIAGGTGVFGQLLASRLLDVTDADLVIGSRDAARAARVCERLRSSRVMPTAVDLVSRSSFERAVSDCTAIVCTAGPFQHLPPEAPRWAVALGAHWLDIADDPNWILGLLRDDELRAAASASGVVVAPGLSTTPAVSGALVEVACRLLPKPEAARICLFVGNRNAKGPALLRSAVAQRLKPSGHALLPVAGSRLLFACPSADAELLRDRFGVGATFFVAPELAVAAKLLRFAPDGRTTGRVLGALASLISAFGGAQGVVEVEVRGEAGSVVASASGGQDLAIQPCVLAVRDILDGHVVPGVHPPADVTQGARLLRWLASQDVGVIGPRPGHW